MGCRSTNRLHRIDAGKIKKKGHGSLFFVAERYRGPELSSGKVPLELRMGASHQFRV